MRGSALAHGGDLASGRWAPTWLLAVAAVSMLVAGVPAFAQDEFEDADVVEELPSDEAEIEQIDEILEGEEEVLAGGGYTYDPAGRRDPFISLLRRTQAPELTGERPPGIPGLLIDELDVKGIFELGGRLFAQVQTADRDKSFLIQEGDQLFDGEVVSITLREIVFKQIVNDPSIIKPFREVVKRLQPES